MARLVFGDENADDNIPSAEFTLELRNMEVVCQSGGYGDQVARSLYLYMQRQMICPVDVRVESPAYGYSSLLSAKPYYSPTSYYSPTLLNVSAVLLG